MMAKLTDIDSGVWKEFLHPRDRMGRFTESTGNAIGKITKTVAAVPRAAKNTWRHVNTNKYPEGRHVSKSVKEAEEHAKSIGVKEVNYGKNNSTNLHIANTANQAIEKMSAQGYPAPSKLATRLPITRQDYVGGPLGAIAYRIMKKSGVAAYRPDTDTIYMNPNSKFWKSGRAGLYSQNHKEKGLWSSGSPDHILVHEQGHKLNYENRGLSGTQVMNSDTRYLTPPEKSIIGNEVSLYGTVDADEAVAEIFAGYIQGERYSGNVYQIYDKYGGYPLNDN